MNVFKLFGFLFKNIFFLSLIVLVAGKIFFPQYMEDLAINPVRQVPVVGQVLGVTWDKMGEIGPAIANKTVELADKVEKSDLPINEIITNLANEQNPASATASLIEQSVNNSVKNIENLPAQTMEKLKEQIRKEMYKQICTVWLEENGEEQ